MALCCPMWGEDWTCGPLSYGEWGMGIVSLCPVEVVGLGIVSLCPMGDGHCGLLFYGGWEMGIVALCPSLCSVAVIKTSIKQT